MIKRSMLIVCSAVIVSGLAFSATPSFAQKKTVKACEEEWRANKAANEAAKITEKAYVAKCRAEAAKPAAAAPTTAPAAPAATTKMAPAATKKSTDGRQAEYARERACGADWKADKAAGKVPAGMTWPKYWSECDKRKKAAGM
ncbi:MAG TPA: hypothetical protein VFJ59_13450 [Pseudolabrys sp.]|nr:hypothetical protein [Pseudolabrys sp.]